MLLHILLALICFSQSSLPLEINNFEKYTPTWDSLDSRPLPSWYDDAKFGIFLHWGVFSVPGFGSEWFWHSWKSNESSVVKFMQKNYPPKMTYQDFAKEFTAEFFEPKEWAQLFEKSGARYVVLTSKHHEGYTLWPSKVSFSWNAKDVGPNRDLVGELADAIRNHTTKIKFGLYHSLFEWYNPIYLQDEKDNFTRSNFPNLKTLPELFEIVLKYRPEVIWSDGDASAPDGYWRSKEFLAWLYNESPVKKTVVVNDRWGAGIACKHGGYFTCHDRYNPGILQKHKWENAMTIDRYSWGYRRNARIEDFLSSYKLVKEMVITVSCGGNILMNIGPTKEGTIAPIFQERLLDVGRWLKLNGEAIYETKPWVYQNDTNGYVWYTRKNVNVYAICLKWPEKNVLELGSATKLFQSKTVKVTLLGDQQHRYLKWTTSNTKVQIYFPDKSTIDGNWIWVIKIKMGSM